MPARAHPARDAEAPQRATLTAAPGRGPHAAILQLQRDYGNAAVARMLQRVPARSSSVATREVRAALVKEGWSSADRGRMLDAVGSEVIRDDIGVDRFIAMLREQGLEQVLRAVSIMTPQELAAVRDSHTRRRDIEALGTLRLPTEIEIARAYATRLRQRLAAIAGGGPIPGFAADDYEQFRSRMERGEVWAFTNAAPGWVPLSTELLARRAAGPVDVAQFAQDVYGPRGFAGWVHHYDSAGTLQLQAILGRQGLGLNRPFDAPTRKAIAQIAVRPHGAARIVTDNVDVPGRFLQWFDFLRTAANPAEASRQMDPLLAASTGAVGMNNVLNHLDRLLPMAPSINALRARTLRGLPFTTNVARAGGLRGHFIKHVLGVREPAKRPDGQAEAAQWMSVLGLAPNGLINRGALPALPRPSLSEWEVFQQHARWYRTYQWYSHKEVVAASTPTNAAEVLALIRYFQTETPQGVADAAALAAAHEAAYARHVATAFDAAANRFLYFDGAVKVNAVNGPLFMVAAWNGSAFDLSTGFFPTTVMPQYNKPINLNQRMLDL